MNDQIYDLMRIKKYLTHDNLTFEPRLEKDKSFTIHKRHLQKLAVEMYRVKHKIALYPLRQLFVSSNDGNCEWVFPRVRKVNHGIK